MEHPDDFVAAGEPEVAPQMIRVQTGMGDDRRETLRVVRIDGGAGVREQQRVERADEFSVAAGVGRWWRHGGRVGAREMPRQHCARRRRLKAEQREFVAHLTRGDQFGKSWVSGDLASFAAFSQAATRAATCASCGNGGAFIPDADGSTGNPRKRIVRQAATG